MSDSNQKDRRPWWATLWGGLLIMASVLVTQLWINHDRTSPEDAAKAAHWGEATQPPTPPMTTSPTAAVPTTETPTGVPTKPLTPEEIQGMRERLKRLFDQSRPGTEQK
jgi:hypothetical protein